MCGKRLLKELNTQPWSLTWRTPFNYGPVPIIPFLFSTYMIGVWFQQCLSLLERWNALVPCSRMRVVLFMQRDCPRQGHHSVSCQGLPANGHSPSGVHSRIDGSLNYVLLKIQHFPNHQSSISKPAHQPLCQHAVNEAWYKYKVKVVSMALAEKINLRGKWNPTAELCTSRVQTASQQEGIFGNKENLKSERAYKWTGKALDQAARSFGKNVDLTFSLICLWAK